MGPGGATGEGGAVTAVQPCAQPPFPSLSAALRWFQVQLGLGGRQAGLMGTEGWPFRDPGLAGGQDWSCAGTPECPLLRDSSNTPSRDSLLRCGGWESLHGGDTGNAAAEGGEGQPHVQWTLAGSRVGGGVCVKFGVSLNPLGPLHSHPVSNLPCWRRLAFHPNCYFLGYKLNKNSCAE